MEGRSRIRAVQNLQMDNLRGLLGIRRMDRSRMCGVTKGVDERIDEGILP